MSGPSDGEDVRLQEAREEEDQEAERRVHGAEREADLGEGQQQIRRKLPVTSTPLPVARITVMSSVSVSQIQMTYHHHRLLHCAGEFGVRL